MTCCMCKHWETMKYDFFLSHLQKLFEQFGREGRRNVKHVLLFFLSFFWMLPYAILRWTCYLLLGWWFIWLVKRLNDKYDKIDTTMPFIFLCYYYGRVSRSHLLTNMTLFWADYWLTTMMWGGVVLYSLLLSFC